MENISQVKDLVSNTKSIITFLNSAACDDSLESVRLELMEKVELNLMKIDRALNINL